ncbi:MAG: hypothetical protein CFE26_03020 [Verrucomicrobiales bacterium VVV1]|nr:MAG: hypothetical protein CFE26_03020 [Verrucomicrobiales bacterium VVV1]
MKQVPFPSKEDLVIGWIALQKAPINSENHHEAFWSFTLMDALVENFPEEALDVIKRILEHDDSPEVLGSTAAGPIEQLLVSHGSRMIDAIEEEARTNPRFQYALGGVWRSDALPEVWKRIEAVRKEVW